MLINGRWVENITCRYCRYRHPPDVSCAEAKLTACKTAAERADKAAKAAAAKRYAEAAQEALELKPCPFCGAAAVVKRFRGSYGYTEPTVRIECSVQDWVSTPNQQETVWIQGKGHLGVAEEALQKCIDVWNRRA